MEVYCALTPAFLPPPPSPQSGYAWVIKNNGLPSDDSYPYVAKTESKCYASSHPDVASISR